MKKAILLLHGFATDKTDFNPIIPFLKKLYDHVENNNLPGHSVLHLKGFTAKKTISDVEKQMIKLEKKYDVIDVIGFSMGGVLATHLASHYRVNKLVLLAPANLYINANYPISRFKKFMEYLKAKILEEKEVDYKLEIAEFNQRVLEDKDVVKIVRKFILPNYNLRTIREFRDIVKYCRDNIKSIDAKTLVIMGDIDQLVPESSDEYLSKYCKNKTTVTFKNVSHMMLRSKRKKEIIREILDFLS
ncbi:MAG: alpha/beta fold hydrolase [Erysipelotrichales bacterium]|nr:alpha/beta fold hydrolase [Erysipelotrichales bacterium]